MNRKKLMSIIGASVVAMLMNYSDVDAATKIAKVNATSLNFRTGPSTKDSVITSIKKNVQIEVIEYVGDWAKIKYNNKTGYVSKQYLTEVSTSSTTKPSTPSTPSTVTKMTVTASKLNVRSGAGTTYKTIGSLVKGKEVEVVQKQSNGWCKIKYGSRYGYVSGDYLKAKSTSTTPAPTKPSTPSTPSTVTKMTVTATSLNVRSGAGTTNKIIGSLTKGKEVEVVQKLSNGWCKIKYGSGYGYVSGDYLKAKTTTPAPTPKPEPKPPVEEPTPAPQPPVEEPKPEPEPPVEEPQPDEIIKMVVTATSLNVRSGAGTTYGVIGSLSKGNEVDAVEKLSNGWYKIKYGSGYGYVSGSYLTEKTSEPIEDGKTIEVKYVNATTLNIRDNYDGVVIGTFKYGDKVEIVENLSNGWSKIKYNNGYAYVSSSYLSNEVGQRPLPTPTTTQVIADPGENDKPTIAVDIGHNVKYNTGAAYGIYKEDYLTKVVGEKVINKLRSMGYHVIETLPQTATSSTDALKQRTDFAKLNGADIFVSIHFNAGGGQGTEVFYGSEGNSKSIATNIVNNISSLGFKNRGIKYGEYITNQQSGLYVLNQTDVPAVLVEGFFIDSSDVNKFIDMGPSAYDKIADAIVNGLIK